MERNRALKELIWIDEISSLARGSASRRKKKNQPVASREASTPPVKERTVQTSGSSGNGGGRCGQTQADGTGTRRKFGYGEKSLSVLGLEW